jgi:hypothetical protein
MILDWDSFWINIIAGSVFFILSIPLAIWIIPKFTIRLIGNKNKKYLILKLSAILQELCEFTIDSKYRDKELNKEHLAITTKKSDFKNFKFVGLCNINVFNKIVYPKMSLIIYDFHKKLTIDESYEHLKAEYNRLKSFRRDIEIILSAHSLHINEDIISKISILCLTIRKHEIEFKTNITYDEILAQTKESRNGIFGLREIPMIYEAVLHLIMDIIKSGYFEYKVTKEI